MLELEPEVTAETLSQVDGGKSHHWSSVSKGIFLSTELSSLTCLPTGLARLLPWFVRCYFSMMLYSFGLGWIEKKRIHTHINNVAKGKNYKKKRRFIIVPHTYIYIIYNI